jgi:hypothetical protein
MAPLIREKKPDELVVEKVSDIVSPFYEFNGDFMLAVFLAVVKRFRQFHKLNSIPDSLY